MAQQHKQAFCHHCGELTLHVADVYSVPHVVHLLLTLLTCLFWLWIWLLHIAINSFSRPPFLCSRCGRAEREKVKQPRRPLTDDEIAWAAERREARRARRQRLLAGLARRIAWCTTCVQQLPATTDAVCRRVAGDGNTLVYYFLWCLVAGAIISTAGVWVAALWAMR